MFGQGEACGKASLEGEKKRKPASIVESLVLTVVGCSPPNPNIDVLNDRARRHVTEQALREGTDTGTRLRRKEHGVGQRGVRKSETRLTLLGSLAPGSPTYRARGLCKTRASFLGEKRGVQNKERKT